MLLKELLGVLPNNQKVKVIYLENDQLYEVKGSPANIINNYDYLLNEVVSVAYSKASIISICL